MAKLQVKRGAQSGIFHVFVQDSSLTTGAGKTGLAFNTASLAAKYLHSGGTLSASLTLEDITTLGTYAAPTSNAHLRFKEVNSASPTQGLYEIQVHNDWLNPAAGRRNLIIAMGGAANMAQFFLEIEIVDFDPLDVVRLGLTALPNAAAEAAGGLYTRGAGAGQINQPANGMVDSNVVRWLGTAAATPTVAGVPEVDVTHVAGTAQTAGDIIADTNDIQARLPAALTGGKMESNVGAMTANVITAAATAADAGAELADAVWDEARAGHVAAGSFGEGVASVQGNVTGSAASVTGAVGSVTGAVGSVTGAVGSVTGAVGSVTADVPLDEAAIADAVWDEPLAQGRGAGSYGETYKWLIAATTGTADAGGSATTIVDIERGEADTDYWKGSVVLMTSGPNIGLLRRVTAFNATTDTMTVAPAFPQAVATGNTYMLIRTAFNEVLVDAIKAGAVVAASFANSAIDNNVLATNAISAGVIAAGAITAAKFAAGAIDAAAIGTGAIDADAIAADAITAAKVAAGTIDAATFAAGAIDAASIATGAITAAKFAAGAIDAAAIANAAIDAATFAAGAVDAAALAADAGTEIAAAVWDRAESSIVAASSIGVKLKNTLPQKITKNTALANFMFLMVDSTDHVTGKTGLTITAERSLDGAAFAACANAATELANGMYKISLAATDLNAEVITLKFTGTAADARFITIVTEPAAA